MKRLFALAIVSLLLLFVGALSFAPVAKVSAQAQGATLSWSALFFPTTNLSGTSVVATYPNGLNQNWGSGSPRDSSGNIIAGMPADNFSARFSATTTLNVGFYEIIILADDGVRFYSNGTLLIDDFGATGQKTRNVIVQVVQAGSFQFLVEYVEFTGNALIQVNVVSSTGTPQPTGTPSPIALVNVVNVNGLALRTGPFLGASLVGVARPSNDYSVLARNTQEGLFTWYLIQYDIDTQGWVSGRYLNFTLGTPDGIPIRNSTQFDTVYDPPGRVIGLTRSVMNFRVLPSERVARVAFVPQLPWGAEVEILARTVQGGRDFWYQVRYTVPNTTTSYVGWIYAPFVGIQAGSDPIDTVPIL